MPKDTPSTSCGKGCSVPRKHCADGHSMQRDTACKGTGRTQGHTMQKDVSCQECVVQRDAHAAAPFPPPCGRGHGGRGCPLPERSPVSGGAVREEPSRPRGAAGGRMSFAVTAAGWRLPTGPASAKSAEVLQLNWVPAGPRRRLPAGHSALLCSRRAGRHGDRYRRLLLPARPQAPRNLQHLLWKK